MRTTHETHSERILVIYHLIVCLIVNAAPSLTAQELCDDLQPADVRPLASDDLKGRDTRRFAEITVPGTYEVPATKATARFSGGGSIFASQNSATLGVTEVAPVDVADVVDLSMLRDPSPFRRVAMAAGISLTEASASNLPVGLALLAATYGAPAGTREATDCQTQALSVGQQVKLDPAQVLVIVEKAITANAGCACEVVKAALTTTTADEALTARIVETAATADPVSMRLVAQCAIATVPESLSAVQAVLARLDPGSSGGDGPSSNDVRNIQMIVPPETSSAKGDPLNRGILWIAPHLPFHRPNPNPPPVTPVDPGV